MQSINNWGFHMTSRKLKLENFWSSWDFPFMIYKSSYKVVFLQIFAQNGSLILCTWYTTLDFLSFCLTRHLHDGRESCHVGLKSDLFRGNLAIWTVHVFILMFLSSSKDKLTLLWQNSVTYVSVDFRPPCNSLG